MKKKLFISFACLVAVFGVTFGYKVYAASVTSSNILKTTDILGISVVQAGAMKIYVVDRDGQTGDQVINLPSTTNNHGLVYAFKQIGSDTEYSSYIDPASGDKLDHLDPADVWYMGEDGNSGEFAIMVADDTNNTWWIVSSGDTDMN